jgi:hypothetical protein
MNLSFVVRCQNPPDTVSAYAILEGKEAAQIQARRGNESDHAGPSGLLGNKRIQASRI